MDLLGRFQDYLEKTLFIAKNDRIIVAVSGGRDSMLMAYLFVQLGYDCRIAHCNFSLRGIDADEDEALVRRFARLHDIPCFVQRFDTMGYAKQEGISIQMAARTLRYAWFETLRQQEQAHWIAIAQHQNDHIETTLLNLTRGTGLRGLRGILPKQGFVIRPLLFLSSAEVSRQVATLAVPFRDDQSNFATKYARNKMRIEVLPKLQEISPDFEAIMLENIANFSESYALLQSFIAPIRTSIFQEKESFVEVAIDKLAPHIHDIGLLYELFSPYGFSKEVLRDLQQAWDGEPGKRFQSPTYELLLDRSALLLRPMLRAKSEDPTTVWIDEESTYVYFASHNVQLFASTDKTIDPSADKAKVDYEKLQFPLMLRFWKQGDVFYPLGMRGKQKLSDYFVHKKVSLFEKGQIPVLCNGNGDIIWIVGYRLDNRYRITESTKKVLTLVYK